MGPVTVLDLVSQQARWLTLRQATIAQNIAQANTPGFKSVDLLPFEQVYSESGLRMTATSPKHLAADPNEADLTAGHTEAGWETTHSGNSVSLEQELMKTGEIHGAYTLNTNIARSFQQMLLTAVKA
ncbi:flagellar basal body rod protein FlgB [Beijerinckia indica]|uniref:Flagellar basal body rod protein FlgB n=1 Tax=Beijerinckia indica subsp. indica (strain ATCC 9039 / DSM 1715 / NCIMB 8712) TaxID=395963 RepID=B2IGW2_BEII9|nr:flagellar basal body rod protein FlgB [Beijerinckia indica]ACB97208.1 flagellar basal body rod protein FlgB [Beijerinckia indica subsp. indica ATCC 9039]